MPATAADPTDLVFWSVAGVFLLAVIARLLWTALRQRPSLAAEAHPSLYATHQKELESAAAQGEIAPEELPRLARDLARATLDDASRANFTIKPTSRGERLALALLILVVVPGITLPVYLRYGSPAPPAAGERPGHHMSTAQMVDELERRIAVAPEDPEPRLWLARVYMSEEQFDKAVEALAKLNELVPDQPPVLLQYADALAMRDKGRIGDEARRLIDQALRLEPDNVTGLWLAGVAAEQAGDIDAALASLQAAHTASLATDLPVEEIESQIREIASRHGREPPPLARAEQGSPPAKTEASADNLAASAQEAFIEVEVGLADGVAAGLPPATPVFILARAMEGPPMPLAVKRITLADLPIRVRLDETLAMSPQLTLASAENVTVIARIALGGQPVAQPGDIEARSETVPTRGKAVVRLMLEDVLP
jgi:cytochrome c-type biogenesis protein CcmH